MAGAGTGPGCTRLTPRFAWSRTTRAAKPGAGPCGSGWRPAGASPRATVERRIGSAPVTGAFYEPRDGQLVPSELTRGPWDPNAQHAGPPSALIVRALERCRPREGLRLGRISIDILGPVPLAPLTVEARVVRPGRSVELLEATLAGPAGELMRASAWRVAAGDQRLPDDDGKPPPGPEHGKAGDFFPTGEDVGYHTAMEYSFVKGGFLEPGPATVWMRMRGA